jgi:pyrimidine deaminase RibD-like protein
MQEDEKWMKVAIDQAKKCISVETAFNVGAVLISSKNKLLSVGYSRELPGNTHAEECCFLKLNDKEDARGGTIYTTMEPCGKRLSGKQCCAQWVIDLGLARVVQGVKEPTTFVGDSVGTEMLLAKGIVVDYLDRFAEECLQVNGHLVK